MNTVITEGSATAQVICDSVYKQSRLVSVEVTFPRPFLAEFNTHCRLSRNSASSRAIPVWKRMIAVLEEPYIPNSFGMNQPGMQAGDELSESDRKSVVKNWLFGRDMALITAYSLVGGRKEILAPIKGQRNVERAELMCSRVEELAKSYGVKDRLSTQDRGLHKQHANRPLETYSFHTVITTATHWRNFFGLRASTKAQPEACDFAIAIAKAMQGSTPTKLSRGEWHLPYISAEDRQEVPDQRKLAEASSGKCARTSYLTHDGLRSIEEDLRLFADLLSSGHMSPFQHPARPRETSDFSGSNGNYSRVWTQLRKLIAYEHDFTKLINYEDLVAGCRGDEQLANFMLSYPE